jgi:hypothetical protein
MLHFEDLLAGCHFSRSFRNLTFGLDSPVFLLTPEPDIFRGYAIGPAREAISQEETRRA